MKFKHYFKVLLSNYFTTIKAGPLKDRKWIWISGNKYITGREEPYKTEAFLSHFKKGEIFFDIGAHIGYFSAMASVLNNGEGKVFAFEPRPMNIDFFKKHMAKNHFSDVTLFEVAVGDTDKEVRFDSNRGSATGRIAPDGNLEVKQVSVGRMVKEGSLPVPTFIKIDVEGGEIEVLKGLEELIATTKPKLLVATHNAECHSFVLEFLDKYSYSYTILNPDAVKGDTEIIALPGVH
ncbi:MAG: FkbM family methyltransferase [Chitinophagaceae bacterium]|nr:FkbM family methyltransferase [Chitinophagaceae bacterium]